eukprot:scaffold538_cov166-Amphora_coffeaeformis.AAC.13
MAGLFRKLKIERKADGSPRGKPAEILVRSLKVLENVTDETVDDEKTILALQDLYHVTEKEPRRARVELVHHCEAKLVPLLLNLVSVVCQTKSHTHSLILVLLNNLSTEAENQRFVALDCGAVKLLCQMLCEDPSCHLIAVCLVNLSFSNVAIRRDWVGLNKDIHWMQALTFCIRVGSMTREEYHLVQPFLEEAAPHRRSPSEYLGILQAGQRTRSTSSQSACFQIHQTLPAPEDRLFPETVRWCLCILKNLSRPHVEVNISDLVFASGIVPFLFQCVTLCHVKSRSPTPPSQEDFDDYEMTNSTSGMSCSVGLNSPETWDSSSIEDAALYVLMNLAADDKNHQKLVDMDAILLLSLVTQFTESHERDGEDGTLHVPDYLRVMDFQSLKARISMAFILGSTGHFGQSARTLERLDETEEKEGLLTLTKTDALQLLELLANTLHSREKIGPGGYSAFAMSPKLVLKAIRCFLVEYKNQILFSELTGTRLNALLLKAMALHVFNGKPAIDAEAAEEAVISLYLQSNHGFKFPFLATVYGVNDPSKGTAARVLAAFARLKSTTAAGKHASQQLVQRVTHLQFGSSDRDTSLSVGNFELSDFLLPSELLKLTKLICLPPHLGGQAPRQDLFDRPIVRQRLPRTGEIPWASSGIEWFPSALVATQDLVFESIVKRPQVEIDDVSLANVIAQCADGDIAESHSYIWAWADDAQRIKIFFESNSFLPCSGQRGLSSNLLRQFAGGWACGQTTTV